MISHEPVCCKCSRPMYPRKNSIPVVDIDKQGRPYQFWQADKWRCPECKIEIATGFSDSPVICLHTGNFRRFVKHAMTTKHYTECRKVVDGVRSADENAEWAKEDEAINAE